MANVKKVDRVPKPSAVIQWHSPMPRGKKRFRMCTRCMLYLNAAYQPDASEYTRAWIRDYNARPAEEKCDHMNVRREIKGA